MEIAVTLNGKAVALIDRDGYMWAGTTDFKVNTRACTCICNIHVGNVHIILLLF